MNLAKDDNGKTTVSLEALKEALEDYKKELVSKHIYIGRQKGFLDDLESGLQSLVSQNGKVFYSSTKKVVEEFVKEIPKHIK